MRQGDNPLVLSKKRSAFINLQNTASISAPAALVLAAEIERCRSHAPGSINGVDPRDSVARKLLYEVGFHNHLNFRAPNPSEIEGSANKLKYIQMVSGKLNAPHLVERIQEIIVDTTSDTPTDKQRLRDVVSRVVGEAMLNVNQHAYSVDQEGYLPRSKNSDWWLAGYRSRNSSEVGVIFFDQGIGIPRTMPANWSTVILESLIGGFSNLASEERDAKLIEAAMEIGGTRMSGLGGRGLGLNDLKMLAHIADNGELSILSRHGTYIYSHVDGEEVEYAESFKSDLRGTLIIWRWALEN